MQVRTICVEDLSQVARLEAEVYPENMRLGYVDFVQDFEGHPYNMSVGAFVGERMVGYVVAYANSEKSHAYVSDLVCTNPKALLPMLHGFRSVSAGRTIRAELREASHSLMIRLQEKFPDLVSIESDRRLKGYYGNEDAYKMLVHIHRQHHRNVA